MQTNYTFLEVYTTTFLQALKFHLRNVIKASKFQVAGQVSVLAPKTVLQSNKINNLQISAH